MPVIINDRNSPFDGRRGVIVRTDKLFVLVAFNNGQSFWFAHNQITEVI